MWRDLLKLWKQDNLLKQAWEQSFEMLKIAQEMFLESVRILRESDELEINKEVKKKDKLVNKYERDVRRKVLTHLTVQGPIDVPAGLVLVTIIIDIERIGDYTKNIFDLAVSHPERLPGGKFEQELKRIEAAVKDNFDRTEVCLESCDQDGALQLLQQYNWVNKACDDNLDAIISSEEKDLDCGVLASLALYFRYLKRINAHLRTVTSSVVNPFDRIGYKFKGRQEL
jgi:phosphate uptake regulator